MGTNTGKTYSEAFPREVDLAGIDVDVILRVFSGDDGMSIVIDPSFIQKSGGHTPAGFCWSGVAGTVRHGLKINPIGVSDVERHDYMTVTALMTPSSDMLKEQSVNLSIWYLITIGVNKETLHNISGCITADAYFVGGLR